MSDKTVPVLTFISPAELEKRTYHEIPNAIEDIWNDSVVPAMEAKARELGVPYEHVILGFKGMMREISF